MSVTTDDLGRPEWLPRKFFVGFKAPPDAAARALISSKGGQITADFTEINALAVDIDEGKVGDLAAHGAVEYVERDVQRYATSLGDTQLVPSTSNGLYGLVATTALDAHARGVTGAGIKIGIADTGLDYTHPDIAPAYMGGIDTVGTGDGDPFWNNDPEERHGTHVAGTIVAAHNTSGVLGVAYSAELYHARVLGPNGGSSSDIMEGVRHLVQVRGVKVVNMSLGGSFSSRTEESFYKEMRSKGALVVAASGNDGRTRISYPAKYTVNIAVGAVDRTNARASFSNSGKELDVVAPGVSVLSSVPSNTGHETSATAGALSYFGAALEFSGTTAGVTGTLVDCGTGQAGEFPAGVAGNVALIQRGTSTFADKVTNALDAGATAVIIYNDVAGDFTGTLGAAGTWLPAIAVSDTAGAALKAQAGTATTVVNHATGWAHFSGTSMATPHVTGVIALIWSANPALSHTTVESHLFTTCTDLGAAGFDTNFGRGLVNASAAVAKAGK